MLEFKSQPSTSELESSITSGYDGKHKYGPQGFFKQVKGAARSVGAYVSTWLKVFGAFAFFWVKKEVDEELD